jgi:hypothetical protein
MKRLLLVLSLCAVIFWSALAFCQVGPFGFMGSGSLSSVPFVPIGTPASIGGIQGNSSGATVTFTTTANIASGDLVAVCILAEFSGTNVAISSVSDGTNTYSSAITQYNSTAHVLTAIYYKQNAAAVSSGATMTVTFASSGILSGASGFHVSGVLPSSSLDQTNFFSTNNGSSTTTTGTLSQSNEIIAGCATAIVASHALTYSGATGFTNAGNYIDGITDFGNAIDYVKVASTTTVSYAPVWAGSATPNTSAAVATFKGH